MATSHAEPLSQDLFPRDFPPQVTWTHHPLELKRESRHDSFPVLGRQETLERKGYYKGLSLIPKENEGSWIFHKACGVEKKWSNVVTFQQDGSHQLWHYESNPYPPQPSSLSPWGDFRTAGTAPSQMVPLLFQRLWGYHHCHGKSQRHVASLQFQYHSEQSLSRSFRWSGWIVSLCLSLAVFSWHQSFWQPCNIASPRAALSGQHTVYFVGLPS